MIKLYNDDCLKRVEKLVDEGIQVDSIVTDPPYHLISIVERFGKESQKGINNKDEKEGRNGPYHRTAKGFMGKEWDGGDIAFRKETWELFMKVLKPGGHLLAFSGSRTYHRMAVAIEDAGFDIRDQIMWLYGSGFPKSLNLGKSVDKKLGNERIKTGQTKTHSNKGMPQAEERTAIGAGAFGQKVEEEITVGTSEWEGWGTALKPAHEPIVLARKSLSEKSIVANVLKHRTGGIHIDACRIEYADENDRSGWHKTGGGGKGYMDTDTFKIRKITPEEIQESTKNGRFPANFIHDGLEEDWARFFYCPKTSKSERGKDNNHPTVKPVKLMKYLCRLVTPKGGTVLDPFMGSGSTGIASKDEGFNFIGIERDKEYFEIADARINTTSPLESFMK